MKNIVLILNLNDTYITLTIMLLNLNFKIKNLNSTIQFTNLN